MQGGEHGRSKASEIKPQRSDTKRFATWSDTTPGRGSMYDWRRQAWRLEEKASAVRGRTRLCAGGAERRRSGRAGPVQDRGLVGGVASAPALGPCLIWHGRRDFDHPFLLFPTLASIRLDCRPCQYPRGLHRLDVTCAAALHQVRGRSGWGRRLSDCRSSPSALPFQGPSTFRTW